MRRVVPQDRIALLGHEALGGLSAAAGREALARFGPNDLLGSSDSVWGSIARDTLRDPMPWFLLLVGAVYALAGERVEALALALSILPVVGMDAWLHRRTSASVHGLRSRIAARARVVREGVPREIAATEIVPGDLVLLSAGDWCPADGILASAERLQVDESMLSGEAHPVRKRCVDVREARAPSRPLAIDAESWTFAGTRVLTGSASVRVLLTGSETLYGEIARSARAGGHARTPLQLAVGNLVRALLIAAALLCVALAWVRLRQGFGWVDALLSAATLAVAALPEELPVVFVMFLGAGAYRMARRNALVRRSVSVENIGRVSCIGLDKTGTITEGELRLAHLLGSGADDRALLETAAFASRAESGDPLDIALLEAWAKRTGRTPIPAVATFPFTENRRRETAVLQTERAGLIAHTKGAPELVLSMCDLSEERRAYWDARAEELARGGHKVIACASRKLPQPWAGGEPDRELHFEGLAAFEDPVRQGVAEALVHCRAAGIRVVMITGDHASTALAVAHEIGLGGAEPRLQTGDEIERRIRAGEPISGVDLVVRAVPSQKLALVHALQAAGEIVAVTGDGVNDVPALQAADVGIAMGERATRAARDVASIVLLDDSFPTLAAAIGEGRQLFHNLQRAFAYLLMIHIPLVSSAALIPLAGFPLLYLPIHIVWLELVIHPSAILSFQERPASGAPPLSRARSAGGFFSRGEWLAIAAVGGLLTLLIVFGYDRSLGFGRDVAHARAMALVTISSASAVASAMLSGLRTASARWVASATLALAYVLVQMPLLAARLHLQPLHLDDWLIAFGGGALACSPALAFARRTRGARSTHAPAGAAGARAK